MNPHIVILVLNLAGGLREESKFWKERVLQKYFRELCNLRHRLYGEYGEDRSINNTKRDLLDEIARRWSLIVEDMIND